MTTPPTISVVIPVYDQADFIEDALDSVAAQTCEAGVETIVVDDGSGDETAEVAGDHRLDPMVIRQSNRGVAAARNRGIDEASGRWIAFLDADDRWRPSRLADQLDALEPLDRPALSFCRYQRRDVDGEPVETAAEHPPPDLKPSPRRLLHHNFIGTSTVLVHRKCLERCEGFPTDAPLDVGGQDYALWLRIAAYFPLVYVPTVAMDYTVHADNRVGVDPVEHHRAALRALRNFRDWDPDRFRALAPAPLTALAAARTARLAVDSLTRRQQFSRGALLRGLASTASALLVEPLADG